MRQASQLAKEIAREIIQKTDLCVMCGLCLPHCPTYRANQNEAESPRGRISVIKALAEGKLGSDAALDMHLHNCTGCLSCEAACPAKVPYSTIIDQGRSLQYSSQPLHRRALRTLLLFFFTHRYAQTISRNAITLARWFPERLSRLTKTYRFTRIAAAVEENKSLLTAAAPAATPNASITKVTLFSGCTGQTIDHVSLRSAEHLLTGLGFHVNKLPLFTCCGALQQHTGQEHTAKKQMLTSANVIANESSDYLLSIATGCGVQIDQYAAVLNTSNAKEASSRHYHILDFLERHGRLQERVFSPLPKRVLIHVPCSMMQSKQDARLLRSLFSHVPELECVEFEDPQYCCGAGGLNLVTQVESAQRLLAPKLEQIMHMQPDIIVSPNIGCALHLRAALKECGTDIEVSHPVTLLLRQLSQ